MSAKDLLIAHGEKAAVAATLLLCAYEVFTVWTDTSIRPNITPAKITEQNAGIDKVFAEGKPPVLRAVPNYLGDMQARFSQAITLPAVEAWLTAAPDRGPSARGMMAYVYEVPAPSLTAVDAVGKAVLTSVMPVPMRAVERRLSDAPSMEWRRQDGSAANRAEVIGLRVDVKVGDGPWKPYHGGVVVEGFAPLADIAEGGVITADGLEPWVRHTFRTAALVKATGYDPAAPQPGQAVLVMPGRVPGDDVNWNDLAERLRTGDQAYLARFAIPLAKGPAWASTTASERLYVGGFSPEVAVQVTSDIRFAFDKVGTDAADPTKELAHVLVTRMTVGADGAVTWLAKPEIIKVAQGQPIAGEIDVRGAKGISKVRLNTGFAVEAIKRDQKRILYYEIKEKAREGSKGKDLDIVPKEVLTEVLVVRNIRSKSLMELIRLGTIRRPGKADAIIFPAMTAPVIDEDAHFRAHPGDFQQSSLVPPAPKMHKPGTGPLVKIRVEHPGEESFYETDTAYAELADGRVVWYEPINRRLRQWPEADAMAVGDAPTDDKAAAPTDEVRPPQSGAVTPPKTSTGRPAPEPRPRP